MSSIRGGATGAANKPRQLNVNQVFTGKNLAVGKAPNRHGMVSMGRSSAVFRRMPPHITLPSIKAETGQDSNINLIPPGASGWSKGDSTETQRSTVTGNGAGSELRPTWAAPAAEPTVHPPASSREFPSLGHSAQGKETNAWTRSDSTGGAPISGRTYSGSQSADDERPLPTRYFDGSATKSASSYRPRFQGSNDARASQPGFLSRNNSDRERGDSLCESIGAKSDSSDRRVRQFSESFEGSISEHPEEHNGDHVNRLPKATEEETPKPQNGNSDGPQPGVRILTRPQKILPEVVDDDEQKQLTKLNRPSAVPLVRRTATGERIDETPEKPEPVKQEPRRETKPQVAKREEPRAFKESPKKPEPVILEKKADEIVPAPPPAENFWAKRKVERESQEKEQKARLNKSYQQTMEHHFPVVGDTASIKVDKDAARRPVDTEFTRETLRARRVPTSNDVRNIIPRDDDRRNTYSREECAEREFNNRFERYTREDNDAGDYRGNYQRNQRNYQRDRFDYDDQNGEVEPRHNEHYQQRNEHYHARGRAVPKASNVRSRGRGRTTLTHHRPHPTHQILKRPQRVEYEEEEEKHEEPVEEKPPKQEAKPAAKETASVAEESQKVERVNYVPRGRGRGRGRGEYRRGQTRSERPPKSGEENEEEFVERAERSRPAKYPTRGIYNPRGRQARGSKTYVVNKTRPASKHRSSEEPSIEDSRLKSPVVSSEGHEEWETASESSNRIQRSTKEKSPKKEAPKKQEKSLTAERIRSKNGQPARRTCRSPSGANSNQQEENKQESNKTGSDGLAGLDVNNFSKVVAIDNLHDAIVSDGAEETGSFEEVLNKKAKRQKQLEEQQRLEAAKKREQKEKERLDKMHAKKEARKAAMKESKKKASELRKAERQKDAEGNEEKSKKEVVMTTVWNSAHVKEQEKKEELPSHIPSPIARPTPRTKATPEPTKDDRPVVEMPTSTNAQSSTICAEFDFTFDPAIREKTIKDSLKKVEESKPSAPSVRTESHPSISTTAPSESGSVNDDSRLKEKINKVKDLWVENDKEASSLPSNVAKVKPQPQGGEQAANEDPKESVSTSAGPSAVQRSPSITPFSNHFGGISFPNYLPDMSSSHYAAPSPHNNSPMMPPNATSPPSVNIGGNYAMAQPQRARNFIENPMYNAVQHAQRPPQNMWASAPPAENMMSFSNAPSAVPPPQQAPPHSAQFSQFNNRQNMPPPQMQRAYPPNPSNMHHPPAGQQHKMGAAPPVMFQSMVPMDMMSMNIPPPHGPPSNPQLGAVGSQRNDNRPFQSIMTNSYGGPPLHQPPHQFNQPPPSLDIRFTHPPPFAPSHADMHWNSNKPFGNQQQAMGGNYRGYPSTRVDRRGGQPSNTPRAPPPSANDVWSNMNTPIIPPSYNGSQQPPQNRMFAHGPPKNPRVSHDQHMKRPSSAGQQPNGTSA